MKDFFFMMSLLSFIPVANRLIRVYFTAKHPAFFAAWDAEEARRQEKQRKLAGGLFNAGLGIVKVLLKK